MVRKIFTIILLIPLFSFSQDLVGTWIKNGEKEVGITFFENGKLDLIDLKHPDFRILQKIEITYKKVSNDGNTFLIIQMFRNGEVFETKKIKYFYKKRKLYLPKFIERNNIESVKNYEDEYVKLSKREMKKLFKN